MSEFFYNLYVLVVRRLIPKAFELLWAVLAVAGLTVCGSIVIWFSDKMSYWPMIIYLILGDILAYVGSAMLRNKNSCRHLLQMLKQVDGKMTEIYKVGGYEGAVELANNYKSKSDKESSDSLQTIIAVPRGFGSVSWPVSYPMTSGTSFVFLPNEFKGTELEEPAVFHELGHIANRHEKSLSGIYEIKTVLLFILGIVLFPTWKTVLFTAALLMLHALGCRAFRISKEEQANLAALNLAKSDGRDMEPMAESLYKLLLHRFIEGVRNGKGKFGGVDNLAAHASISNQMHMFEQLKAEFPLRLLNESQESYKDNRSIYLHLWTQIRNAERMQRAAVRSVREINVEDIGNVSFVMILSMSLNILMACYVGTNAIVNCALPVWSHVVIIAALLAVSIIISWRSLIYIGLQRKVADGIINQMK